MSKVLEVKIYGDEILKQIASPISEITNEISELISDMIETMYHKDGIGIAAPQVGVSVRIIVCDYEYSKTGEKKPIVYINPEIIEFDGDITSEEGCLSVPNVFADVTRFSAIKIKYLDINMKEQIVVAEDTQAVVLQHEIDHLNGILFVDKVSKLKRMALSFKLNKLAKNDKNV